MQQSWVNRRQRYGMQFFFVIFMDSPNNVPLTMSYVTPDLVSVGVHLNRVNILLESLCQDELLYCSAVYFYYGWMT